MERTIKDNFEKVKRGWEMKRKRRQRGWDKRWWRKRGWKEGGNHDGGEFENI